MANNSEIENLVHRLLEQEKGEINPADYFSHNVLSLGKKDLLRLLAKAFLLIEKSREDLENLRVEVLNDFENMRVEANNSIKEIGKEAGGAIDRLAISFKEIADKEISELHESLPAVIKSDIARNAALSRHSITYEKRDKVIEYWREHIPPETSNEKAGEWLKDTFPELSVRKLSEYVAYAKREAKKTPPASKA